MEEVGQPELIPFRQREKGTEQTGTLSESARHGRGQPEDRQSLYGAGLIRQERDGGSRAVATARVANDMAARLRSGKHVEEMKLPRGRNAPARRSAKDSEKARKGDGADCDFFGGSKRCKFRLSISGTISGNGAEVTTFTCAWTDPELDGRSQKWVPRIPYPSNLIKPVTGYTFAHFLAVGATVT